MIQFKVIGLFILLAAFSVPLEVRAGVVSQDLLKAYNNDRTVKKNVIIEFESIVEVVLNSSELAGLSGGARQGKLVSLLREKNANLEASVLGNLSGCGVREDQIYEFWIASKIGIKDALLGQVEAIGRLEGNFTVREAIKVHMLPSIIETVTNQIITQIGSIFTLGFTNSSASNAKSGVSKINAPKVWATGNKGQNVLIAVTDTGINANHDALRRRYKGDAHSWKDAVQGKPTPYDDHGHGSHCAGIAVGDSNGIGVAPEAKIIACKALDENGDGNEIDLTTCGEFVACPYEHDQICDGIPQIATNSWGAEGDSPYYSSVINVWRAANIIPIFAIGNSGPLCDTSLSPGNQPNLISVGLTKDDDSISSFSSRGRNSSKPEVSAPGWDIVSASHSKNDAYVKMSGTSMSCPNVAGAAALILSAHPDYTFDDVMKALTTTVVKPSLFLAELKYICISPSNSYPNNAYGMGRIDAYAATNYVK